MAKFLYTARDEGGKATTGEIVAGSRAEAAKLLRHGGMFVVKLDEAVNKHLGRKSTRQGSRRVPHRQIIYFANQLAIMVDTGVPLADALAATVEGEPPGAFRTVIEDVINQVQSGQEFSAALARHPRVFPRYFANIIRASEASGLLGTLLQRVALYMNAQADTRKRIIRAMMYPAAMISFCALVATFLLIYLIPKFVKIFESRGASLPKPTQILIDVTQGFADHALWIVPLGGALAVALAYFARTPRGRVVLAWLKINTPIYGQICRKAYITSSMRTMGTMIDSGVSMLDTIAVTRDLVDNHYYEQLFDKVDAQLRKGNLLSDSLKGSSLFPHSVTQMVLAGERSGQMGPVMNRVADFCDQDLNNAIQTSIQLMQPVLVIFMGIFIGGVVIALLLPIFSLSRVITGS